VWELILALINGVVTECDENEELSVEDLSSFRNASIVPIIFCDVKEVLPNTKVC